MKTTTTATVGNNFHVCVVIMAEVRLVNRYIIYIFNDNIIMLITTIQVHILYNTVWVMLFVVAASLCCCTGQQEYLALLYIYIKYPRFSCGTFNRICSSFVGNKLRLHINIKTKSFEL